MEVQEESKDPKPKPSVDCTNQKVAESVKRLCLRKINHKANREDISDMQSILARAIGKKPFNVICKEITEELEGFCKHSKVQPDVKSLTEFCLW